MFKLLIVDDEQIIRDGLKTVVSWDSLGFSIAGAVSNGRKALEFLTENPVDVILADIKMPGMTGLDLASELSRRSPGIRIVILSGFDDFEFARKAIHTGVVFEYLLKPCREEQILDVFSRLKAILEEECSSDITGKKALRYETRDLFRTLIQEADSQSALRFRELAGVSAQEQYCLLRQYALNPEKDIGAQAEKIETLLSGLKDCRKIVSILQERGFLFLLSVSDAEIDREVLAGIMGPGMEDLHLSSSLLVSSFCSEPEQFPGLLREVEELLGLEVYFAPSGVFTTSFFPRERGSHEKQLNLAETAEELTAALCRFSGDAHSHLENLFSLVEGHIPRKELYTLYLLICQSLESQLTTSALPSGWVKDLISSYRNILPYPFYFYQWKKALTDLMGTLEAAVRTHCSSSSALVGQALSLVQNGYSSGIGLDQVAHELSVTPEYLSRIFKKESGENFRDYITSLRMRKARELLEKTTLKVKEIARQVGFQDARYFGELFRKNNGVSAGEYRNRARSLIHD